MLNRLRHPGSNLRSSLLLLACAALLVRALVPVGYMLGNETPDGHLAVLLCPAHSQVPNDSFHLNFVDDHGPDHDPAAGIETHQAQTDACPFSLAFVPLITASESPANLLVDIRDALFVAPRQPAFGGNPRSAISARGPPQHS